MKALQVLDPNLFLEKRRDHLLPGDRYTSILRGFEKTLQLVSDENIARRLSDPDDAQDNITAVVRATRMRAWAGLDVIHALYSGGNDCVELARVFSEVLTWWEDFAKYDKLYDESPSAGGRRVPHLDLQDSDYWKALRLTSLAILLGHTGLLPRVAALWDYENDEMDGLLERLVAPFVPGRPPPPDTCTRHLPYFKLLKVFDAPHSARPALMSKYMDEWYTASRREPYFGSHTKGREHSYLGLWSFEAAAVSVLLGIDDSSYRNKDFYPGELAGFARSLSPSDPLGP